MNESLPLNKLVVVRPRFARSISLVRDVFRADALDGYVLTPTGHDVLRRLAAALHGRTSTRAWSLTGPYGSGKSAFALLLAQLLTGQHRIRQRAREFLESWDESLAESLFGKGELLSKKDSRLLPVLVTGSRRPLEKELAAALALSLRAILASKPGRPPQIIDRLEQLARQPNPSGNAIVRLFEEANDYLGRFEHKAAGILLIVDELGKFLEHGATSPDQGDVFVLQEMAEAATRSRRPFLFLTILHQAIDRYAEHMSPGRRAEWAKIQGRFEDVAFEEQTEQQLRLISHAIRLDGSPNDLKTLHRQARNLAQEALALGIRAGSMVAGELQECLVACYPLHPLTALLLGPLFRQLAQNERSLFAFLSSSEPHGFQEFLREQTLEDGPFRLDHLFDYALTALGPTLFAQHRGKLWAEVQSALDRLHDASELEVQLTKTIGLLQALGNSVGLPASSGALKIALKGVASEAEVETAIQSLTRRSVAIFRRHTGSYVLWEGSDVDIEERLQAARRSVERDQDLADFLTREVPPRSLVARRHYFQTGTLRFFEASYCDRGSFQTDLFLGELSRAELGTADGRLLFCLPRDADEREAMRSILQNATSIPVVAALPREVFDLHEMCHELVCLRWVASHTPELETDRTARREVQARLGIAEQNLRAHLEWMFSPANTSCTWYHQGEQIALRSQRELNDLLSDTCDKVYSKTPHWRNELINRRTLSSAAAAARRNLIEAMFEHAEEEGLGIQGYPPERSMYETLLGKSRLHRKQGGAFGIFPPDGKAEPAVREMWGVIDHFLAETDSGRSSVENLFAALRSPPFGLKDGVLPVILAALLVHGQTQVALYEEGSFVPRPNAAVFERIFRAPGKFEIQRFRIAGPRAEVFKHYASLFNRTERGEPDLLTVVRPLVRLVKELPDYVTKTRHTSETAQKVLRATREARQPDRLLFEDLPVACGFPAFRSTGQVAAETLEAYFVIIRSAFAELQRAYPQLLSEIERLILKAFGEEGPLSSARRKIEHHARLVMNVAVDAKLKAFLLRAADDTTEDATWLESIATLLASKPTTHWDDQDRARFEVQLAAATRTFDHFRVLAFEMERSGFALLDGDQAMLRVSVTVPEGGEVERVVKVPPALSPQAKTVHEEVKRILRDQNLLDDREASAAILAQIVRELLTHTD